MRQFDAAKVIQATNGVCLQRKCDCGKPTQGGGTCSECREKAEQLLHREPARTGSPRPTSRETALQRHSQEGTPREYRDPGFVSDFSAVPTGQRRTLVVSQPGDALEKEADRIADQVVRSRPAEVPGGDRSPTPGATAVNRLQRQEDATEWPSEEEELFEPEDEEEDVEEPTLVGDASGMPKRRASVLESTSPQEVVIPHGSGRPMVPRVQTFMEGRMGRDFSGVRVHTDAGAAASAEELAAEAYTVGSNIYFGMGRYEPATAEGQRLLAHELVHVVQQTGGAAGGEPAVQRQKKKAKKAKTAKAAPKKKKAKPCCKGACDGSRPVSKNNCVRHPWCDNEKCEPSGAADSSNFIRHLDVNVKTHEIVAEIGSEKAVTGTRKLKSSPRAGTTPPGMHKIGRKCGACHTNMKAEGMAWFVGFAQELRFGFHNSQPVGKSIQSSGCVRVEIGPDEWINKNTASGVTTVCIHSGDRCGRKAPKIPPPEPKGGGGSLGGDKGDEAPKPASQAPVS